MGAAVVCSIRMLVVNRVAIFAWAFASVLLVMVAAFTALLVRDGPPPGYSAEAMSALLAAFWLAGLGLAAFASSKPYVRVAVTSGGLTVVTWRHPFSRVSRTVPTSRAMPATVVESQDDEGALYFLARTTLADGSTVDLGEGHDRDSCEDLCRRFNELLDRHRGVGSDR